MNFVEQLTTKLYYSKLHCLTRPSLKDDENYIYNKKTDSNDIAYYMYYYYSKCQGSILIKLCKKENLNASLIKFFNVNPKNSEKF